MRNEDLGMRGWATAKGCGCARGCRGGVGGGWRS